jgi:N-ethylmaleimide reductase
VRFLGEVTEAVVNVCDQGRVGVPISPLGTFNDMGDANPEETFACVVDLLNGIPARHGRPYPGRSQGRLLPTLAIGMEGTYIANAAYDAERGEQRFRRELRMPWHMAASSSRTQICPNA